MTLAVQQAGRPRSRIFEVAHRVARRLEPSVVAAFLAAIERLIGAIDLFELEQAVASGNLDLIASASHADLLAVILDDDPALEVALRRTSGLTGDAVAKALEDAAGISIAFNARHQNVTLYAMQQTANLVVQVSEDVREAIRIVIALGSEFGITPRQQAVAIRQVVGLPPNWASAPLNLGREIRDGLEAAATDRRLSAVDKQRIRSAIRRGTVTDEFIKQMQERYTASLRNRRALNIARTETLRAAHSGQREAWKQGIAQGALPSTIRRIWIVTPDDRLRPTHAAVPGLNPDGVPVDGVFNTPLGPSVGPPLEPNCRCGEGLIFPGRAGVL